MRRLRAILMIVGRSLRQHALSTTVTIASAALATGLTMAVFNVSAQSYRAFTGGPLGFDAVLGARGSQLQLVLNTVFHLETSPGNIPWSLYQTIKADRRVALAIPYAVGDNYKGYRIVGTTGELFSDFQYQKGRHYAFQAGGRAFDPTRQEAVLGSTVARETGLKVGDAIHPYHGIVYQESARHEDEYVVVGVLQPTNTPSDRVVWIPIEGVFRMGGHELWGSGQKYVAAAGSEIPDEHKEISAVMLVLRGGPQTGAMLQQEINKQGDVATLAWPLGTVMAQLFAKLGWVNRILELVAYLVLVVAAGSILASLYNTMNERRREFAILRALGARRGTVFAAIVAESSAIALLGSLFGLVVYVCVLFAAGTVIRAQTGVVIDLFAFHPALVLTPAGTLLLGAAAGLLPARKAYATDVASNLVPAS